MEIQSQVEKHFIQKSGYKEKFEPQEKIRSVVVDNFPELGRLTALRFLEWVQQNPEGVISLPTGKTPEHFIKWVNHYLNNWESPEVQSELEELGLEVCTRPEMKGLHFVQMDEFYPINSAQHNSFCNYVKKYYIDGFGLDPAKAMVIDCNQIGLQDGELLKQIWPEGFVNLELRNREPKSDAEVQQKRVLAAVDLWCLEYEQRIQQLGGIGFFLGGIGPDGHIAFNVRGSAHDSITRLTETNYETQAAAAGDLGGIEISGKLPVITIGLKTITQNPYATIVIISAGEAKAQVVSDAIQNETSPLYPATALRKLPNAVFFITKGSAKLLNQRNIADLNHTEKISVKMVEQAVVDASLSLKKPILAITDEELGNDAIFSIILQKQAELNLNLIRESVHKSFVDKIEKGVASRSKHSFLHTEPHHDDIMLGYQAGLVRDLHDETTGHVFATLTSGFTAVTNDCILERVDHVQDLLLDDSLWFRALPDEEIQQYLTGLASRDTAIIQKAEALRFLRCMSLVFKTSDKEKLRKKSEWIVDYIKSAYSGQKDPKEIQLLKGMMREWEAETLWGVFGVKEKDVYHLRLGFYQGDIFNEEPTKSRDLPPVYNLIKAVNPSILSVALDPEASGPDTHYKVLQAIAEGIRQIQSEQLPLPERIWGYRNVWYRFHPAEATVFIPVSLDELAATHSLFMKAFVTQRHSSFPSHEYNGPFSELAQQIQVDQFQKMEICLGKEWFQTHKNQRIRSAKAMVYLQDMSVNEFLSQARELKEQIESL